jgi:hypothetical protein
MPPLLCPSPIMIDQSFPRDDQELLVASRGLGELISYIESDKVHLLLTDTLREFVNNIDWQRPPVPQGILREIYIIFHRWFLQPHARLRLINVENVKNYLQHPIPEGCQKEGLIVYWSDEMGRILVLHDKNSLDEKYYIGVACANSFAGKQLSIYAGVENARFFPLVGPTNITILEDAYEWIVTPNWHQLNISFEQARNNCHVIGATRVEEPDGDSHYKVHFPGARPWILDFNVDPIPLRFLNELVPITKLPLDVIKHSLFYGAMPRRRCKI